MNRRIRNIFWLMTICIVAINAFQGYWLWNTYQLQRDQFFHNVQDALVKVLESQQIEEAGRMFGNQARVPGRGKQIVIRQFNGENRGERRLVIKTDIDAIPLRKGSNSADTLSRRISDLLVAGWSKGEHVDLREVRRAYHAELASRGITAGFLLDTIRILPRKAGNNVLIFDTKMTLDRNDGRVRTAPLALNPVKHLFVTAAFDTPVPYLLRRMGWLLGASVSLLVLTTGCFLFMLNTILKQKRLSEIKNDFINNMTHELKTPIATVHAAVEAMMNFGVLDDPEKTRNYLSISQNNLTRLSDLVEKVLNLAVEEKQEMKLYPEPVNLSEMIHDLTNNYLVRASKPVSFDLNIPLETTVSVDKIHFTNVLSNLIDNAINYSYDKVTVCFRFIEKNEGWQLAVADNGIGIAKMYQDAVFDRFFRVPTGNLHTVKGFGLGLAYVRQVVERHGGRISVASEPGKGSEFVLTF